MCKIVLGDSDVESGPVAANDLCKVDGLDWFFAYDPVILMQMLS